MKIEKSWMVLGMDGRTDWFCGILLDGFLITILIWNWRDVSWMSAFCFCDDGLLLNG